VTKHILFTGGGSAGHVTPNLALIINAQKKAWRVSYAGSSQGIERALIKPLQIPFYPIQSGKLKRHFSWDNFLTPIKLLHGIIQAYFLCKKIKPTLVFSKGGFVAVPIVIGAWLNRIPIVVHESDLTPGLANRLSYPFAKKVALSFEQSKRYFRQQKKLLYTGTPVREAMLQGNAAQGKVFCGFINEKPILLIYGGGLGSSAINAAVWESLPVLLRHFNIVHCTGKDKSDQRYALIEGYRQFEYLHAELPDVMAAADLVLSRAGANSIYELLQLAKPHLLIPLSKKASRGDQIDNAQYFAALGLSTVLLEEELTAETLQTGIDELFNQRAERIKKIREYCLPNANQLIMELLETIA
jgi:UDP-N-acetylglucosamine--N-acetylmuramyl-(pentapeptide) pyrophosphoryl-undecaprenol N-acetylglucosamine transferase